jgi:tRNA(Ile)-lysidine synthase
MLGHTADDQAETVLLGLARGSGLTSLAGMRPAAGNYLRPFLGLRRADTEASCAALGLPVWQDPHNVDPRFRRVRVRSEVLPLMEDVLGDGVTPALARTATQLQDAEDVLDALTDRLLADSLGEPSDSPTVRPVLLVEPLSLAPAAPRQRAVKRWAESCGAGALSAVHVAELDSLITHWRGQGPIDLPSGSRVIRSSGRLKFIAPGIPPERLPTPRQQHATHQE